MLFSAQRSGRTGDGKAPLVLPRRTTGLLAGTGFDHKCRASVHGWEINDTPGSSHHSHAENGELTSRDREVCSWRGEPNSESIRLLMKVR